MKVLARFEISEGYEHWKKVFMSQEPIRKKWGIKTIIKGSQMQGRTHMNPLVHVCLEIPDETDDFIYDEPEIKKVVEYYTQHWETEGTFDDTGRYIRAQELYDEPFTINKFPYWYHVMLIEGNKGGIIPEELLIISLAE